MDGDPCRLHRIGHVAPRLIVITATIEPVEFFYYARQKGNVDEALDQFIRRLASVVKVFRADDINRYLVQHIGKIEPYEWHQCSLPAAAHTPAYLIKVSAQADGTFTVTNTRNNFSKTYQPRP